MTYNFHELNEKLDQIHTKLAQNPAEAKVLIDALAKSLENQQDPLADACGDMLPAASLVNTAACETGCHHVKQLFTGTGKPALEMAVKEVMAQADIMVRRVGELLEEHGCRDFSEYGEIVERTMIRAEEVFESAPDSAREAFYDFQETYSSQHFMAEALATLSDDEKKDAVAVAQAMSEAFSADLSDEELEKLSQMQKKQKPGKALRR